MKKSRSKSKAETPASASSSQPPAAAQQFAAQPAMAANADNSNAIATVVEAKIDVGFGNHLYIRGGGAGLSWSQGTPLDCEDPSTWIWRAADVSEPFEFKLLINDENWCIGANYTAQPGAAMQVIPHFAS